ncbi:MAG: hypothetical protein KGH79_00995 [Patescibacteria group bacterium]|nr:hypothetical protein [Patescibacteria group bacterium]
MNGVFDTLDQAKVDREQLEFSFKRHQKNISEPVIFQLGYNPTHIAGAGDAIQSTFQQFNSSVSNYDLDTILMEIAPEVTTRKLLIVGHSQGADYANEMYDYLTGHGESKEAVGVYAEATPANYVASNGKYLTSATDNVISAVAAAAGAAAQYGVPVVQPLPPNIIIPVSAAEETLPTGGHSFIDDYLAGASDRIVSDISGELSALVPSGAGNGGCFTPPAPSLGYKAQTLGFAIADPAAVALRTGVITTAKASEVAVTAAYTLVAGATQFLADTVKVTTSPPSQAQADHKTLKIVDKLYGGDLSDPELQDLLGNNQGSAVALAAQGSEQPVPVDGGFVEGTSTSVVIAAVIATSSAPTSMPSIFPQTANGQVWVGGGSAPAQNPPAQNAPTPAVSDTSDATADDASTSAPMIPPEPFDASTTAPIVSVPACAASLSPEFCFLPATDVTLTWDSVENALQYGININGTQINTITGTSTTVTLADDASSTVKVVAYDASSTPLASNTQTVYAFTKPVVINEVAWSGTNTSPTDQWVELKNRTPYLLDASKLILLAEQGGAQYVPLTGTIYGLNVNQGFPYLYLLERTQTVFTGVSGSTPQFAGEFDPLDAAGEQLALAWSDGESTTTLDETPAVATCGGWCAGRQAEVGGYAYAWGNPEPISMERISSDVSGTLASNWASNDGYITNADDGNGQRIIGSPGYQNSNNWPLAGFFCDGDASILVPTTGTPPVYAPQSSHCTYLAGFIGSTKSAQGGIFEGTVGSSTLINSSYFSSNSPSYTGSGISLGGYPPGQYFVAMWELNYNVGSGYNGWSAGDMMSYIKTGFQEDGVTAMPPVNNYVIIPFTYAPQ